MKPMLAQVVVLSVGCWQSQPTPAAKPDPAPPFVAAPPCPAVMRDGVFQFVRGELFTGCSPPQFEAADVRCAVGCPLPCGATLEANREAGFLDPHASWLIYYDRTRYGWTQQDRSSGRGQPCEYDRDGRATACAIGGTQDQRYTRDAKGRLVAIDVPESQYRIALTYDARGDLTEVVRTSIDRSDTDRTVLRYDAQHRLLGEQRFEMEVLTGTIEYTYSGGRVTEARGEGPGVFAQLRFTYDDSGRLVQTERRHGNSDFVHRYRYDTKGRPVQIGARRTLYLSNRDEIGDYTIGYRYKCE